MLVCIAISGQWTASSLVSNTNYGNSYLNPFSTRSFVSDSTGASHLVYYNNGNDAYFGIYYKKLNGGVWESKQRLDDAAPGGSAAGYYAISWMPALSVEPAGNKMVVWEDYRTGSFELFAKYYNGSLWSSQMQITASGAYSWYPKTQYRNGKHHLFYLDDSTGYFNIYYTYYDSVWASPVNISDSALDVQSQTFFVKNDGTVSVAYTVIENGYYALYNKRKSGSVWGNPIAVYKPTGDIESPFLISDDIREFVVFTAMINGISQLYLSRYSGSSWSEPVQISDNNANIYTPQALIKGDTVHITAISDYFINGVVEHYKYSISTGDITVSDAAYRSGGINSVPNITMDYNSRIHLVFVCSDEVMDPISAKKPQTVYYSYYLDGGFTKSSDLPYFINYSSGRIVINPVRTIEKMTILDKTGRTVYSTGGVYSETDVSAYLNRSDIYFLRIKGDGKEYSEKILWIK